MTAKKELATDFAIFDVKTGAEVGCDLEILTPAGKKSGVVFKLLGRDSAKYQELALALSRKRIDNLQKTGRPNDIEAFKDDSDVLLAAVTVGWTPFMLDGEELPCTTENARRIYNDPRFVSVREQVEAAVNNRANFTKA